MTFTPPPCKDCTMRFVGCHADSACLTHKQWKAEENRKNAELNAKKAIVAGFVENETNSYIKHVVKAHGRKLRGVKAW